jgi:hypothetical protein
VVPAALLPPIPLSLPLPGDPGITFLRGVALEGTGNRQAAAVLYRRFLQASNQGQAAQYAATRLQAWGVR